ncbi:hypothetical protein TNCV_659121 [Trichonephila clavipes]|nr:hypothetical protein TNCV_659121 [Trichonephila clavipes]
MVAERLARQHTAVTTVDKLWHHVEAACASVPVIQSLFDSSSERISAARGDCVYVPPEPPDLPHRIEAVVARITSVTKFAMNSPIDWMCAEWG